MRSVKHELEDPLNDLLRELKQLHPKSWAHMIEGLMKEKRCSQYEAIRTLAEFEDFARRLLEASRGIGKA
jgi:DMSO/TMAO reductase YedYZ molybdopterin-dependent catalytic subunit